MMLITTAYPIAAKDYPCDAMETLIYYSEDSDFDTPDLVLRNELIAAGTKIKKGDLYKKVAYKFDGEFGCYRASLTADGLCQRAGLCDD